MNNINVTSNQTRPNRQGANNPMYGRHHSEATKQKQSDAAKRRAAEIKKWKDSQHHITMDEFLSNNPTVEQCIKTIVKEQIDRLLWRKENQLLPN